MLHDRNRYRYSYSLCGATEGMIIMMRKKRNLVFLTVGICAVLIVLGVIIFGAIQRGKKVGDDEARKSETTQMTELSPATDWEDSEVPPVISSDHAHTNEEQEGPDVDVSNMTRNPEAEVVDSQIEYGEKEIETDAS